MLVQHGNGEFLGERLLAGERRAEGWVCLQEDILKTVCVCTVGGDNRASNEDIAKFFPPLIPYDLCAGVQISCLLNVFSV